MNFEMQKTGSLWCAGKHIDWILFFATLPLLGAGLLTMDSFVGDNSFFSRQVIWIIFAFSTFFLFSFIDWRFLKRTDVLVSLFIFAVFGIVNYFMIFFAIYGWIFTAAMIFVMTKKAMRQLKSKK